MAALFRDHCVKPAKETGEDDAAASERVMQVVSDSGMVLLLQMLKPEKVALEWEKRGGDEGDKWMDRCASR